MTVLPTRYRLTKWTLDVSSVIFSDPIYWAGPNILGQSYKEVKVNQNYHVAKSASTEYANKVYSLSRVLQPDYFMSTWNSDVLSVLLGETESSVESPDRSVITSVHRFGFFLLFFFFLVSSLVATSSNMA